MVTVSPDAALSKAFLAVFPAVLGNRAQPVKSSEIISMTMNIFPDARIERFIMAAPNSLTC
jgi:hypothetical protein